MTCSSCGTENPAGRKFCRECGAALAVACFVCGTTNGPDDKFCGECEHLTMASKGSRDKRAPREEEPT